MAKEVPASSTPMETDASARTWKPQRLLFGPIQWMGGHKLATMLIGGTLAVMVAIPATMVSLHLRSLAPVKGETLSAALQLLDEGSLAQARELAKSLAGSLHLAEDELGGPAFVLGAAAVYEADLYQDSQLRARLFVPAAKYLTVARERGFPPGREAEGTFLLGESLYYSASRQDSLPVLQDALQQDGPYTSEIDHLLTRLYYLDAEPDLDRALEHIQQYLGDENLSDEERDEGLLLVSRILFDAERDSESRAALESMSSADQVRAESFILQGRLTMREGDRAASQSGDESRQAADQLYNDALKSFREVHTSRSVPDQSTRRSAYLVGVAYRKLKDYRAAEKQFDRTKQNFFDSEEAIAAGVEKADMLRLLQQDDEAVDAYREALQLAGPSETYENTWIPLDRFVERVRDAYDDYVAAGQFERAVALAQALPPTLPPQHSLLLLADAQQAWVNSLAKQASVLSHDEAVEIQRQVTAIHHDLGATYERLARFRFATREYPQHILRSAEEYLAGSEFASAARQYQIFLNGEPTARRADALMGLGQAWMALDQLDRAVKQFRECIEFHEKDPAVYTARLLCAEALMRMEENDPARKLLEDNLFHSDLTPQSTEWRDSLFKLGQIDYEESSSLVVQTSLRNVDPRDRAAIKEKIKQLELNHETLQEAIRYLREAVERFANAPQAIQARYSLGEAYRLSAKLPKAKTDTVVIHTIQKALRKEVLAHLGRSLEVYTSLIDDLTSLQGERKLSKLEQAIQRNCYFARGYVLDDMGLCDEAIAAFLDATSRFPGRPEALEAFVEIASCHRQKKRPLEARGILAQAKDMLDRMDPNADFKQTTRFSREEWSEYLSWLVTL